MSALLKRLRESREDSGNTSKSIVFSQFTSFLDMLEVALEKDGFQVPDLPPLHAGRAAGRILIPPVYVCVRPSIVCAPGRHS